MHCQEIRQQLATYRELSAAERDQLQEHMSACPSCAAALAAYAKQDQLLSTLPALSPSPALVEAVHARTVRRQQKERPFSWRRAAAVLSLLLCLGLTWNLAGTAADALPGDVLYSVKRGMEQARLTCLFDPAARYEYQQHLAEARREEVGQVIQQGRAVQVEFQGDLVAVDGGLWQVDGFQLTVDTQAWDGTPPLTGSMLAVEARAADGQLRASRVRLLQPAAPTPVLQASPAGPRSPSQTPTARQHSEEATPRPSQSPSAQPSGTPGTRGPGPQPSATPGARGPGPQPSVTSEAWGPGPQPSPTPGALGPGPQPLVTPGVWGPGPQPSVTPGAWAPGPQPSVTLGAGEPGLQPSATPATGEPGGQPSMTPGAGNPGMQPSSTPGTGEPGGQPSVTPGAGNAEPQPSATPGAAGPGPRSTVTPGQGGR